MALGPQHSRGVGSNPPPPTMKFYSKHPISHKYFTGPNLLGWSHTEPEDMQWSPSSLLPPRGFLSTH